VALWKESTAVHEVTIRAVGEVDGHIDVTHAGTREAVVSVSLGPVLARLYSADVAHRIRETWKAAAVYLHRLPNKAHHLGNASNPAPVGIVIRIGYDVPTSAVLVPATSQLATDHLRIQVGPLIWQIMDRAAYRSVVELWERAERMFV
jgi:hypothetical protein